MLTSSVFMYCTHKVHPVFRQPVEALEEEQECEKGHKTGAEVIPEDCEGKAGLGHCIPWPLK